MWTIILWKHLSGCIYALAHTRAKHTFALLVATCISGSLLHAQQLLGLYCSTLRAFNAQHVLNVPVHNSSTSDHHTEKQLRLAFACCRSPAAAQSLQQQSQGASNNSLTASSSAGLHPLADIYSPEQKSGQSPDRPLTSSQCTELSEELLDLFDSIERLRQEVVALQQPAGLPQTLSQQQEQTTEQVQHNPVSLRSLMFEAISMLVAVVAAGTAAADLVCPDCVTVPHM